MITKKILTEVKVVKKGVTNGRAWTIFNYRDSEGKYFSSFDEFPLQMEVECEVSERPYKAKDGSQKIGYNIAKPKQSKSSDLINKLFEEVGDLKKRVSALEKDKEITAEVGPEIDEKDLPF